jgi:hypothetical protein
MPDPYLSDIIAAQRKNMVSGHEQSQRDQREFQARLKAEEEAERASMRVDKDESESFESGPTALTGEEATQRQAQRQARHMAERQALQRIDSEAGEQLTPSQRKVAHDLGLNMVTALAASRDDVALPNAIVSNFNYLVAVEERFEHHRRKVQSKNAKAKSRKVA